jgi:hypothetical protein
VGFFMALWKPKPLGSVEQASRAIDWCFAASIHDRISKLNAKLVKYVVF